MVCYTDDSRHNRRTEVAVTLTCCGEQSLISLPLGESTTVFQADVLAIKNAIDAVCLLKGNRHIYIYSDSLGALVALQTLNYVTLTVLECFEAL